MTKTLRTIHKKGVLFSLFLLAFTGNAQHFTVTLDNFTSTSNTMEFDIVLIVDAPVQGVRLASVATGIFYNPAILNGGAPCTTTDCGSFVVIPGSRSAQLAALNPVVAAHSPIVAGHLRTTQSPIPQYGVDLLPGTYVVDRVKFTNTMPWAANTDAQLWLAPTHGTAPNFSSNTIVLWSPYGILANTTAYTTTSPANGAGLTLGYTQGSPMNRILNPSALGVQENELVSLQAVPNPFTNTFGLDFETISNEPVSLKVYDMIGKLIDNQTVEASAINALRIGENYQSGIYSVTVSQGEKVQNLRVVKR